jgi:plasmid stabilization system protein ParE
MIKISFRPVADVEFTEAAQWYEDQRQGLGLQFIGAVQKTVDDIAANPLGFPVVLRDIREAIVSKFPFSVYYRIKSNRVVVLAVFHSSRDPAAWQSRN